MRVPGLSHLPPRRKRLLLWTVSLLLFYTVAGFLILPPIIRAVAVKRLSRELARPVTIQKVRLNPFTLSATVRGLLIRDRDGEPFIAWDEVYVNFQLLSLVTRPWVFKEVSTSQPYARVQVNKDYSLNFSDLVEKYSKPSAEPAPAKPPKPLALRVDLLRISGARAALADLTPREPFRRVLGPVEITLNNFRTDPSNKNPYAFAGTTDSGEKFSWSGHFYLAPIRSEGDLTLEGVALNKYAPLYQDLVRFIVRDGVIDLRSTYRFEWSATTNLLAVTNTTFRLVSLQVAEPGAESNVVELAEFAVRGASADAFARRGEIASLAVRDARLALRRSQDASVNVLELAKPADTATNAPGGILLLLQSVTNAFARLLESTNLWTGTLHELAATNCALHLEDLVNARPARLDLDRIALTGRNLSNLPDARMNADLSLRWETNGTVAVAVDAALSPPSADVKLAVADLNLRPLDPYLESHVNAFILRSRFGMDGVVRLRRTNEALPEVTFAGNLRLDDFSSVDGVWTDDLVQWSSLRVSGIDARLEPPAVAIKEIAVNDAYARLIVETNRSINLLTALHLDLTNALPAAATPAPDAPKQRRRKAPASARGGAVPAPTPAPAAPAFPARIAVETVVISNAHLRFTDRSLQPNVNASFAEVGGTIAGISSESLQRADVALRGKVDKTGPVEITGKLHPLDQRQPTELKIRFHDVDLLPSGPYVGKFAGYRLTKGKLSLDLNYHITEGKLKSQNLIVLDQFTLGEKVESPDATKLPVRLAIAVLKDRQGRIELDVPIEGSLDDPEFRLGKVITRAIVNVITKIATSPFAALGALLGGKGEEVSFQDFEPGRAELLPASREKLDALAKGLHERPALQLEIQGSIDPATDLAALRRLKLEREFRVRKWKSLRKSEQARLTPEQVELTPEEWTRWVEEAYAEAFSPEALAARAGGGTGTNAVPDAATAATNLLVQARASQRSPALTSTGKGASDLIKPSAPPPDPAHAPERESQLLGTIPIAPADFEALAAERSQRVKAYLLETGRIEPERVFLTQAGDAGTTTKGSRVYLQLR